MLVVLPWLVWILATLFQMVRSSDPAKENAEGDTEPLPGHPTNTFRYLVFNAGLEGIEPPLTGLEAVVLPLDPWHGVRVSNPLSEFWRPRPRAAERRMGVLQLVSAV